MIPLLIPSFFFLFFFSPVLQKQELDKFLKNADAVVSGIKVEKESDYELHKIQGDNIGFQMLKKAGWSEGGGLGDVGEFLFVTRTYWTNSYKIFV